MQKIEKSKFQELFYKQSMSRILLVCTVALETVYCITVSSPWCNSDSEQRGREVGVRDELVNFNITDICITYYY